jgi:dTDP-4-amino-4,6-dideoxygalactose transaminase
MPTGKLATDIRRFRRPCFHFDSARSAFGAWLRAGRGSPRNEVLLPAYIGCSPREGSGVFDPIAELGLPFRFYDLDAQLRIDLGSLEAALRMGRAGVVVLIHYFGRVDPGARHAAALAREHGARILEDEAHSMLTDLVGGACGRLGDACVFSLHKLLPVAGGGSLVFNDMHDPLLSSMEGLPEEQLPWCFDLAAIARRRRSNHAALDELVPVLAGSIQPLGGPLLPDEVPQSYPVLVPEGTRDALYERMNERGYGVVSLYHTLIDALSSEAFPVPAAIARRILNLPVHQDVDPEEYPPMLRALSACLGTRA